MQPLRSWPLRIRFFCYSSLQDTDWHFVVNKKCDHAFLQDVEVGPNGLWRVEEALAASHVLVSAGDKMAAHNQGRLAELRKRVQEVTQRGKVRFGYALYLFADIDTLEDVKHLFHMRVRLQKMCIG